MRDGPQPNRPSWGSRSWGIVIFGIVTLVVWPKKGRVANRISEQRRPADRWALGWSRGMIEETRCS